MNAEETRKVVREGYTEVAKKGGLVAGNSCCGPNTSQNTVAKGGGASCCAPSVSAENISQAIGYSATQLQEIPDSANLGLGCGNPTALAEIKEGDVVLDLGSGAGIDVFLASKQVGPTGKVIGVDMTDEMLAKARKNAETGGYTNVEFRKGVIEELPVDSDTVDLIISNCVINLSPEKDKVFQEAHRVLKPGGQIMVSDIVILRDLPDAIKDSLDAYVGCISGAEKIEDYKAAISDAGFTDIEILSQDNFGSEIAGTYLNLTVDENVDVENLAASIKVRARK
ncbi:MAG: arsenite methyltransferase [Leptospirales bacterium]